MNTTKPTAWAGAACIVIGVGHSILGLTMGGGHLAGWLRGDMQWTIGGDTASASEVTYWAVPAGFPAPLILLGLLAVGRAREGRAMPGYVGWTLLAWAVVNGYANFPTGFLLVFVPAGLLLWDTHRRRTTPEAPAVR